MMRMILLLALALLLTACTAAVRVEWATETEMNTAGFNLYRSESPNGPFDAKINPQLIPASPDPMIGGEYHYLDRTAQAGKTYYYQLQEVERDGQVNTYGPIAAQAAAFDWRWGAAAAAALAFAALAMGRWGGWPVRRHPPL
ncbi:MAG: hypothetical protein FJ011_11155 [Chloroflexi bacterium]|nr:hypothetical protein [Chloroflexota bacterium]